MCKKLLATTALLALAVGTSTLTTFAEDASKGENDANVTVKEGDGGKTDPIDPGVDPTEQPGNLTVDGLINFKFKDVNIQANDFKTGLKDREEGKTNSRGVQVTDKRGTGEGWTLKLAQSELTNVDKNVPATSNKAKLKGAYISLPLLNEAISTTTNNQSPAPKNLDYKFIKTTGYGVAQNVVSAAKDTGLGTWVFKYNTNAKNQVELNIPAGNYAGQYEGVMTWTVVTGPAQTTPAN